MKTTNEDAIAALHAHVEQLSPARLTEALSKSAEKLKQIPIEESALCRKLDALVAKRAARERELLVEKQTVDNADNQLIKLIGDEAATKEEIRSLKTDEANLKNLVLALNRAMADLENLLEGEVKKACAAAWLGEQDATIADAREAFALAVIAIAYKEGQHPNGVDWGLLLGFYLNRDNLLIKAINEQYEAQRSKIREQIDRCGGLHEGT